MNINTHLSAEKPVSPVWVSLGLSVLFSLFLFYIDEGYYDFRWMRDPGNWLVFAMYVALLTGAQVLAGFLIFRRRNTIYKALFTGLVALPLAFGLAFWLFS